MLPNLNADFFFSMSKCSVTIWKSTIWTMKVSADGMHNSVHYLQFLWDYDTDCNMDFSHKIPFTPT